MIDVAIVERLRSRAESLAAAIDQQPDTRCVHVVADAGDLRRHLIQGGVDVVLLADVHADELAAVTEQLKGADGAVRVLVVAGECGPEYLAATAAARVDGLLSGDADLGDVLAAIRAIRNDTGLLVDQRLLAALVSPPVSESDASSASTDAPPVHRDLTARELEVLRLLGEGRDIHDIADELGLSVHTVRGYVRSILQKLHARSQLAAVVAGARAGLIPDLTG